MPYRLGLIRAHRPPSAAGNTDGASHDDSNASTPVPAVPSADVKIASAGVETQEDSEAAPARAIDMGPDPIIAAQYADRYVPLLHEAQTLVTLLKNACYRQRIMLRARLQYG